jgi:hypothetical protein
MISRIYFGNFLYFVSQFKKYFIFSFLSKTYILICFFCHKKTSLTFLVSTFKCEEEEKEEEELAVGRGGQLHSQVVWMTWNLLLSLGPSSTTCSPLLRHTLCMCVCCFSPDADEFNQDNRP